MSASLGAGIAALPTGSSGVMLVLGDMPEVTGRDMADLVAAFDAAGGDVVIRACDADGTPGHPVVFPARLFGELAGLTGDRGAKQILRDEDVRLVSLPGRHATLDLDTPEEWAEWSASQSTEK